MSKNNTYFEKGGLSADRVGKVVQNFKSDSQQGKVYPKQLSHRLGRRALEKTVGRKADLKTLRKRLLDKKQVLVINGIGGIGKTTLAEVYVNEYFEKYKHVAWLTQPDDDPMRAFTSIDQGLTQTFAIDLRDKDIKTLFWEVMRALHSLSQKPILIVIDNATQRLFEIQKNLSPDWHILITSRQKIDTFEHLPLGFLTPKNALALFNRHYKRKKITESDIKILLKQVDYHTLTVEILAKTAEVYAYTYEDLSQALEKNLEADIRVEHSEQKIERLTNYLCSIFELTDLSEDEKWLLLNILALPPDAHKEDDLESLIQPQASRKTKFKKHLAALANKGWLLKEGYSYRLHRIIAEVLKRKLKLDFEKVKPLCQSLISLLSIDQAKDNPIDKFPFIPYGSTFLEIFEKLEHEDKAVLQNNLGLRFQALGDLKTAKDYLEKALKSAQKNKNFGEAHPRTATSYSNLGLVLQALGDLKTAKDYLEKALKSDQKNFGEAHPTTATSYSNLGTVLKDLGDLKTAKDYLEKALKSAQKNKNFGEAHPTTATSYSNLGLVLKALGDLKTAKDYLEKALKSAQKNKNFGEAHPTTAIRYSNLGLVLKDLGDLKTAKDYLEKALKSAQKNFGEAHPTTATSYSNLGMVLADMKDYAQAVELIRKSYAIFKNLFGENHPNTQVVKGNLEVVASKMKKK